VAAAPIQTWKDRLKACFSWRHRLMHVFGVPAALGATAAVAAASTLNPDVGLALGGLVTALGVVIGGYYVTAGFDKKVVQQLQEETMAAGRQEQANEVQRVVWAANPQLRQRLERVLQYHSQIEAVFDDGIDDPIESILQGSRADLKALRDRAIAMTKLHGRLGQIIQQSDGNGLYQEAQRLTRELGQTPDGSVREALEAALESTKETLTQWRAAGDKQRQIESVLTIIESNLQQFKLAMELRKADAAMGSASAGEKVSELQARLQAAGEACDELVGRTTEKRRRVARAGRA
jgi:hypothetical protein